jgi:outer membrane protein assembly factor BamB
MIRFTSLLPIFGALLSTLAADNWPQWRGPSMTGAAASNANPPTTWSETQNIKWKIEIPGESFSTPIIWDDQVFIQAAVPTGKKVENTASNAPQQTPPPPQAEGGQRRGGGGGRGGFGGPKPTDVLQWTLFSYDRNTGALKWKSIAKESVPHEGHQQTSAFASASPVTDGQHVWAFFGSQGLHCYDMQGNAKWSKDLGTMNTLLGFGEGSSPALFEDKIIVNWDHEGADFIAAFDKNSGKELWRQPRDEKTSWATPLVVEVAGKPQVITTATGKIRAYDLATGQQIWEHAGLTRNVIPTSVSADGILYATSGYSGSALYAIKLGKTGDLTGTDAVLWNHSKSTPYVPSPLLTNGRLYFLASNSEVLSVFEAKTGKPLINEERLPGLRGIYSSPVAGGGRIYLPSQNGATAVLKDSDKLEILATNQLNDSFNASPAIVGNQLFLRGKKNLYCIAEK